MRFDTPLVRGRFLAREKRFLVHVRLDDGRRVTAHTNNTGRMSGCLAPGCTVWLSPADGPRRRLAWTLELVETVARPAAGVVAGIRVGVNTARANGLVAEAVDAGLLPGLAGRRVARREVAYGRRGSRADLLLEDAAGAPTWVEVKNVTLVEHGHALFPDAPTVRGRKHLAELRDAVAAGARAALVFCVQRVDAGSAGPADRIDPAYADLLRGAAAAGVGVHALSVAPDPAALVPRGTLPVVLEVPAP